MPYVICTTHTALGTLNSIQQNPSNLSNSHLNIFYIFLISIISFFKLWASLAIRDIFSLTIDVSLIYRCFCKRLAIQHMLAFIFFTVILSLISLYCYTDFHNVFILWLIFFISSIFLVFYFLKKLLWAYNVKHLYIPN